MSSDFTLVEPKGWEYDLQSVYSAYMSYFQQYHIPWYDRTWGCLFSSFEEFLTFSWPVITVTDAWTGRAHIVTRLTSIGAFLKMIKTRFGETLPLPPGILKVTPFETSSRHLRKVSDYASYKKLHQTLSAGVLATLKSRVRAGEPKAIQELWDKRDKTFLAIDFEWSERNQSSILEFGYAAVQCGHLDAEGQWPPVPEKHYRKGHYIVSDYVDKIFNKHCPTFPWQYAFGDSEIVSKAKLPQIIQSVFSSLVCPDIESSANTLVLVAHGVSGDLARLEEMKIKLPHNMLIIDTSSMERSWYSMGLRPPMLDPKSGKPRVRGTTLSLEHLLHSLSFYTPSSSSSAPAVSSPTQQQTTVSQGSSPTPPVPVIPPGCALHNAGNDALLTLCAFQMIVDPSTARPPNVKKGFIGRPGGLAFLSPGPAIVANPGLSQSVYTGFLEVVPPMMDMVDEFGQMQISHSSMLATNSLTPVLRPGAGNVNSHTRMSMMPMTAGRMK